MYLFSICKATVSDLKDVKFNLPSDLNGVCKRMITLVINDMEQLLERLFVSDFLFFMPEKSTNLTLLPAISLL